ncbi:hypothetical protein SAMN05216489_04707 [Streptomyces sp. 3213]|uniref:hypothetical protein n=1 Tax=Streptomyces sp. 3213.3 TaxID=1855348 RepID=UPI000897BA6B|nr:hypothetical protein [Streptomyces sp. 3213.3]SED86289.1 hypothetical protein SAMN05216489_04707 [Streptomyces sp. 3213] [Streptomyces sp. 3213.3]
MIARAPGRKRLEARDELDQVRDQLAENVAAFLQSALEPLDTLFAESTVEDTGLLRKELRFAQTTGPWHAAP